MSYSENGRVDDNEPDFLAGAYYEPFEVPKATDKNIQEFRKRDLQLAILNIIKAEKHGEIDGLDRTLHNSFTFARARRALQTLGEKKPDERRATLLQLARGKP